MFYTQEVFYIPFKVLKVLGIWQQKSSTWIYRIYGFLLHFLFIDLFALLMVLYLFHFEDFEGLADCLSITFTMLAGILKTCNFMYKLGSILTLVNSLDELIRLSEWKGNKNHTRINKRVEQGKLAYKIFCSMVVTTCTFGAFVPVFNWRERLLAYRMYFPMIDYKNNGYTFIAVGIYQLGPIFTGPLDITLDMLPVFFMCYAVGLIEELSDRLENIGCQKEDEKLKKEESLQLHAKQTSLAEDLTELHKCIELHLQIKKFIADTENYFATIILVQGVMSSIILCTTVVMMLMVSSIIVSEFINFFKLYLFFLTDFACQ